LYPVKSTTEVKGQFGTIDLLDLQNLNRGEVILGRICRAYGKVAMECITEAAPPTRLPAGPQVVRFRKLGVSLMVSPVLSGKHGRRDPANESRSSNT